MIVNVILALLRSLPQKRRGGGEDAKERRNLGYLGDFGEYYSNRGVSKKLPSHWDVEGPDEKCCLYMWSATYAVNYGQTRFEPAMVH